MKCALLLSMVLVCDVNAQLPAASTRSHTDTAFFNRDTVVLHSTPYAAKLSRNFASYIARLPPPPGVAYTRAPSRIDMYLAEDERAFAALTGGAAPHWGAGIAMPDSGIIVLPAYSSRRAGVQDLGPVIRHELAHVELQRALPGLQIPRWFTEGYATYTAGQLDPDGDWYLRLAFLSHRAPPLDSLELDWPAMEADARVAYLLSASAVAYMQSLGPDTLLGTFITRWRESGSYEHAIRQTYLVSSTQFERLWSKHVRRHYGWLLFAAQGAVVWAFISVLAVAMVFMRRRRDRLRLAELRRNDAPDNPAYWLHPDGIVPEEESMPDPGHPGPGETQSPEEP